MPKGSVSPNPTGSPRGPFNTPTRGPATPAPARPYPLPSVSIYSDPLPVVYGTARCRSFVALKGKVSQGDSVTENGKVIWTGNAMMAELGFCQGPIEGFTDQWWSGERRIFGSSSLTPPNIGIAPGYYFAISETGSNTQVWGYITATGYWRDESGSALYSAEKAVPLFGTAHLRIFRVAMPDGQSNPDISGEVRGWLRASGSADVSLRNDARPGDVLKHLVQLAGLDSGSVQTGTGSDGQAASSYDRYTDACGYYVSRAVDSTTDVATLIDELMTATNSTCYWSEGRLKVIPLGDADVTGTVATYAAVTSSISIGVDDLETPITVERSNRADVFNSVPVSYPDRNGSYVQASVESPVDGDVAAYGLRRADTQDNRWIARPEHALAISRHLSMRSVYARNTYRFTVGPRFQLLEPTDFLTLTEPGLGLSETTVRITEIQERNNGREILAVEWPVGMARSVSLSAQAADGLSNNAPTGTVPSFISIAWNSASAAYATASAAAVTATRADTTASMAYSTASSSYLTASAAFQTASAAFVTASSAFTTASVAFTSATSAFDLALKGGGGGNVFYNSNFQTGTAGVPTGWGTYNNSIGTEPSTTTLFSTGGPFGGPYYRITWTGTNSTTKGIFNNGYGDGVNLQNALRTDQWYVMSIYARTSTNQASGANIHWNLPPSTTTTILNPNLTTAWQRYAWKIKWNGGAFIDAEGYFGVDGAFTGYAEFACPQISEGEALGGWIPNASELLPSSITTTMISPLAITSPLIAANAIIGTHILAGTISGSHIKATTISGTHIAAGTISGSHIAALTISATHLKSDTIQTSNYVESAGVPLTGAKMDITGTALKVAAANLQIGSLIFNDEWWGRFQVMGGAMAHTISPAAYSVTSNFGITSVTASTTEVTLSCSAPTIPPGRTTAFPLVQVHWGLGGFSGEGTNIACRYKSYDSTNRQWLKFEIWSGGARIDPSTTSWAFHTLIHWIFS